MDTTNKRLYRSRQDNVLAGVCGGLGEYLDVDPVLIRVAWVAMVLMKGFGILLYLIWIFVVPLRPFSDEPVRDRKKEGVAGIVFGALLMLLGFMFLADEWRWLDFHVLGRWSWDYFLPLAMIGLGAWFLVRSREQHDEEPKPETSSGGRRRKREEPRVRRFERDVETKKIFGVCAGIGTYLSVDATIVRIVFVVATLMSPPVGILAYIGLAIFTPTAQPASHRPVEPSAS